MDLFLSEHETELPPYCSPRERTYATFHRSLQTPWATSWATHEVNGEPRRSAVDDGRGSPSRLTVTTRSVCPSNVSIVILSVGSVDSSPLHRQLHGRGINYENKSSLLAVKMAHPSETRGDTSVFNLCS
ncbi:hypothetical protein QLX08_007552 [Tetragonisca angustula]|uniref:Uncharacterized protein n=1 Tax=Tetragonisca angustula TaxID=166442 RepID=A0AAW0ZP07_9HYME